MAASAPLSPWQRSLIALTAGALVLLVLAPLGIVLAQAFADGAGAWWSAVSQPDTLSALGLTLAIVLVAVPLNGLFGLALAHLAARHRFPGRQLVLLLADLPFSVPPIITGLFFVMLLGPEGPWPDAPRVLFTPLALVLTTLFVTLSFCLRTLLPLLQSEGWDEEEAATVLGASRAQVFFKVTLPRLRYGLGNGLLLLSARALGEYGAVSVVSGRIRGLTNSLPLQVEAFYFDQDSVAAFSAASLLLALALLFQAAKVWLAKRQAQEGA